MKTEDQEITMEDGSTRLALAQFNQCGECTACCTAIEVRALNKPAGETCEHVCEGGCSIYHDRPDACKKAACMWLQGLITKITPNWMQKRPDMVGCVPFIVDDAVYFYETEEGAALTGLNGPTALECLKMGYPVVVVWKKTARSVQFDAEASTFVTFSVSTAPEDEEEWPISLPEDLIIYIST